MNNFIQEKIFLNKKIGQLYKKLSEYYDLETLNQMINNISKSEYCFQIFNAITTKLIIFGSNKKLTTFYVIEIKPTIYTSDLYTFNLPYAIKKEELFHYIKQFTYTISDWSIINFEELEE